MENMILIGSKEASQRLGLSRSAFNRMVKNGSISVFAQMYGLTGAFLFDADEIDRLVLAKSAAEDKAA